MFTEPAQAFLRRITGDEEREFGARWRPHDDEASPVRCDPLVRFGRPAIGGISTEVIDEHLRSGEDDADVADQFNLDIEDVRWAQAYELSQRSAPEAA